MAPEQSEPDSSLRSLRGDVLNELVGLIEYMADDADVSYELLLSLARNTGRGDLLQKAFQKIQKIEDPKQKADALIDLLDEIEIQLSPLPEEESGEESAAEAAPEEEPRQDADEPQDIPEQSSEQS